MSLLTKVLSFFLPRVQQESEKVIQEFSKLVTIYSVYNMGSVIRICAIPMMQSQSTDQISQKIYSVYLRKDCTLVDDGGQIFNSGNIGPVSGEVCGCDIETDENYFVCSNLVGLSAKQKAEKMLQLLYILERNGVSY